MRKLLFISILLINSFVRAENLNEILLQTSIKKVTVFLTGGEVERQTAVKLKKGRNKLVFQNISTVADDKSIQFHSSKLINLVSVSSEIDYLNIFNNNPRIQGIKDSIAFLKTKIADLQNEKSAYYSEKQLLEKNNDIKGTTQNLTVDELRSMAEFYRKRMVELNKKLSLYDVEIAQHSVRSNQFQNQLNELNYAETVKSNQIIVIVDSEIDQTVEVQLKYLVSNCGWQANYDLLADNVTDKIKLKYKAKVYNNTGNNWNDIEIALSTSDPNITASAPELQPWYLNYGALQNQVFDASQKDGYVVPQNRAFKQYYNNASVPQINQNLDGLSLGDQSNQFGGGASEQAIKFQSIEVSQLTKEFQIDKKYTIPSNSKPYLVDITEHDLSAYFTHKAVPKLDKDAFLLANIVGWESLDLVPGPTQVYFSESYVGQSYINTSNVGDTLRLSFGRDSRIPITRRLVTEFSDKKVIGNNRKDTYTYEIIVKNNRDTPVRINVYDQIPISQDSDISVTVEELTGGELNETTGKLHWIATLSPGASTTYKLSFTIKYPKGKVIKVQKYRTISAPSF